MEFFKCLFKIIINLLISTFKIKSIPFFKKGSLGFNYNSKLKNPFNAPLGKKWKNRADDEYEFMLEKSVGSKICAIKYNAQGEKVKFGFITFTEIKFIAPFSSELHATISNVEGIPIFVNIPIYDIAKYGWYID